MLLPRGPSITNNNVHDLNKQLQNTDNCIEIISHHTVSPVPGSSYEELIVGQIGLCQ